MSAYHLHRVFKAVTGLTPKAYAAAHRAQRVRARAGRAATRSPTRSTAPATTPTAASTQQADQVLGMTPTQLPRRRRRHRDPLRDRRVLARLDPGRAQRARRLRDPARRRPGRAGARSAGPLPARRADRRRRRLRAAGWRRWSASSRRRGSGSTCRSTCAAPRSSSASGRRCAQIPAGRTASYAEIAERIGAPKAVRAVAQACGANPLAVAIPCHRVVRNDGALVGLSLGRRAQARAARSGGRAVSSAGRAAAVRCDERGASRTGGGRNGARHRAPGRGDRLAARRQRPRRRRQRASIEGLLAPAECAALARCTATTSCSAAAS